MRILKFLFSSAVLLAIFGVIAFLITREALLFTGTSTIKSSLTELQALSVNYKNYVKTCREKGTPSDQVAVAGLQLRFLDDQNYVLELICTGLQFDPIVIDHQKLPPFVTKQPGPGGIIWGNDLSAVTLGVLGRTQSVGVQNKTIVSSFTSFASGVSPQTTCQGRGFFCCNGDSQFGTGQQQNQVSDCPKSCYQSCLPRPVVLSFTTDPFLDQRRTVNIVANQTVTFGFVIRYDNKNVPGVTLDFGDGKTQAFSTLTGKTEHLYTCNTGICSYQVHLTVQTTDQIDSVTNDLSQLTVQVAPQ